MAEFKSWRSLWRFQEAVTRQTRYVHDDESRDFMEAVRQTAANRVDVLPSATHLWRAQLGNDWKSTYPEGSDFPSLLGDNEVVVEVDSGSLGPPETIVGVPCPFGPDRMKPWRERAVEGRANSKGIPVLYLSTDHITAIGEVRPWVGAYVSVGRFRTCQELKLVDCTTGPLPFIPIGREPAVDKREELVWACIGDAFARPVTSSDGIADYAPTQIMAELFKVDRYDGIKYRSSLGGGCNIVLFDIDAAKMTEAHLFRVDSVVYKPGPVVNPTRY